MFRVEIYMYICFVVHLLCTVFVQMGGFNGTFVMYEVRKL